MSWTPIECRSAKDLPKHRDLPHCCRAWITRNARDFGTHNQYPAEFHREELFNLVKLGSAVAWVTYHGSVLHGKVVIRSRDHVTASISGTAHGQPGLVDARNIIWVSGVKNIKPAKPSEYRSSAKA